MACANLRRWGIDLTEEEERVMLCFGKTELILSRWPGISAGWAHQTG